MLTEVDINKVEQALDIKLYDWQIEYLQGNGMNAPYGRGNGKTLVYCIGLALSKGERIRLSELWKRSDEGERYGKQYSNGWFKDLFISTWHQLKDKGMEVREIKFDGMNKFAR